MPGTKSIPRPARQPLSGIQQKRPASLIDAVSSTLEMESSAISVVRRDISLVGCASHTSRPAPNTNRGTVKVVPVSHSYTVSGSTQGIPTTFIIDTGAAVTLLRKDMWDKLPQGGSY